MIIALRFLWLELKFVLSVIFRTDKVMFIEPDRFDVFPDDTCVIKSYKHNDGSFLNYEVSLVWEKDDNRKPQVYLHCEYTRHKKLFDNTYENIIFKKNIFWRWFYSFVMKREMKINTLGNLKRYKVDAKNDK